MSDRQDRELLGDILEAARRASLYIADVSYEQFLVDLKTQDAVVRALEQARCCRQRIRVYLGETDPTKPDVGRDWLEEFDVEGHIGNSMGPLRVPLLIRNRRCDGGFPLLDQCIVKIKLTIGGTLYQHPNYHTGTFTIREIDADETVHGDALRDQGYTHAVDVNGHNHANFKTLAAAERYVRRMTT